MKITKKEIVRQTRLLMRLCFLQAVFAITVASIGLAHPNYAQLLDQKITLRVQDANLIEILDEVSKQCHISFVYNPDQFTDQPSINLALEDITLRKFLQDILTPRHIQYKVHERERTITLRKTETKSGDDTLNQSGRLKNEIIKITGTVIDKKTLAPLPGVNILIKGTAKGTTSNADGVYTLEAEDTDVLIFSFIGYATREEPVNNRSIIHVELEEDVVNLKDIVINAGYYKTTKFTQTGNIAKVTAEQIQQQPVQNPVAALQGNVAGLEVIQGTGVPGGNFSVRIRGTNSISNGNDPLYIIDGVPFTSATMSFNETSAGILGNSRNPLGGTSPLNSINPADIESIEILKDADATAIYGSRGSNGVILITTRKGKAGETGVSVNLYSGVGQMSRRINLLNTNEYISMRKEAFANDGVTPTTANAQDLISWDTTRYTDWQKELLGGSAAITDAQITLTGGSTATQFLVGVGYRKESTVFPGKNADQRLSARISLSNTGLNNKLSTNAMILFTRSLTDLLNQDLTGRAIFLPPNAPELKGPDGELSWDRWASSGALENPLAYLKRRYEANTNNLVANLEVSYEVLPDLQLKTSLGYTYMNAGATNLIPVSSLEPSIRPNTRNTSHFSSSLFTNWIIEPQLNWKKKWQHSQINVLMGTQFLNQVNEGLAQTASGFSSEALMKNLAAASDRTVGTNFYSEYRYHAVFGRLNYTYNNKYLINLTGRRDGSSRFGPGNQFANFGAIGAAWIFSEEPWVTNSRLPLSLGKLRMSVGVTGNDQLTDYQYLDAYTSSPGSYQGIVGLTPVRLANPDFAWETNVKMEAAIELGWFKDRLSSSISFYRNRSSNQLVGNPLSWSTGFNSIQANFPATVQNQGVEIEIEATPIKNGSFTWTIGANLSIPRNSLLEFPNLEASPAYANTYVVGRPLNIRKLYRFNEIDPVTGTYTFEDVNQDGSFNFVDQIAIAELGQKWFGGVNSGLRYKGIQLNMLVQLVKQSGRDYFFLQEVPGMLGNQPVEVLDRWRPENNLATYQRFGQTSEVALAYQRFQVSDRSITDASFARLKNLSLSYDFTESNLSTLKNSKARVFIQAQNLLTITKYKGLDPETQGNLLPPLRIITAGISLTF